MQIYEACEKVKVVDPYAMIGLDYVLATTDFFEFLQMMYDHQVCISFFYTSIEHLWVFSTRR
jgi:hypothetical protein